jgi:hypothetical protein
VINFQPDDKKLLRRLTRTIKYINSSQFLQTVTGTLTATWLGCKATAPLLLSKFSKVITNQLISKLVPRNTYKPVSLYPDGKNCAPVSLRSSGHSMLRLLRPQRNPTPKRGYYSTASTRSATFTHFIAGPLGVNW